MTYQKERSVVHNEDDGSRARVMTDEERVLDLFHLAKATVCGSYIPCLTSLVFSPELIEVGQVSQ